MVDQAENLRLKMTGQPVKSPKVIAILSGKGGVGKSMVSINFATALIQAGKKIVIIDLDVGTGNIDMLLGVHQRHTIVDMIHRQWSIQDITMHYPDGPAFISGGSGLSELFQLTNEKLDYLLGQLSVLKNHYDTIIFDLGAGMNDEWIRFIQSACDVFLVTTTEPSSLTNAYATLKSLHHHHPLMSVRCLINRADRERDAWAAWRKLSGVSQRFLNKKLDYLGYLPNDRVIRDASKNHCPFMLGQPKADVSIRLRRIAATYIDGANESDMQHDHFMKKMKQIFKRESES
ncbi:MinD/ParA family protein [Tuberibacillus sp. Marseille-P3662]|uniref:MinD/ParA family protein n=1 Tax=Tuberibacillus sp. Marseille-P3662 TaxID=1965358 RepID=UPI000A1CEA0D|nr:MinD/ParA family protein [Tuberibacillus sp. Marseille-P3662]